MSTPWRSRYSGACLATARGAAVLTAAVLPFSTAATNVLLALVLLGWLASGRLLENIRTAARHPVAVGAAAVICCTLLATLWSDATSADRADAVAGYRKLLLLVILIPLFDTPRRRAALLFAFLGGCVVLLLVSVATYFGVAGLHPDPLQGAIVRRNHITHGFMMALLAFAMATLAMHEERPAFRLTAWAIAALALLNMTVMTRGRTGWLVAVALLLMAAILRARWKGAAIAAVLTAALGAAAYMSIPAIQERVDAGTRDVAELERGNVENSTGIRLHFYKRGLEIVRDHALFGAGTGAWKVEYERRSADDPERLRKVSGLGNPHSDFLTTAVQFGLVGMLVHLTLVFALFVLAGRLPAPDMWMARGLVVAYAVGAVFNSFLWDFTEGHIVVILLVALFGGASVPSRATRPAFSTQHLLDFVDHTRRR
jgi:O-antigen ligase